MKTKNDDGTNEHSRADKREPLLDLLRDVRWGHQAAERMNSYLDVLGPYTVAEVTAACEVLRETWTDTGGAPMPGHVKAAAQKFARKSRGEIRAEQDRQRMEHSSRTRMTPRIIIAELARVDEIPLPDDPFERRVEKSRRESLERILATMEGETPKPRMSRGGGLVHIGDTGVL